MRNYYRVFRPAVCIHDRCFLSRPGRILATVPGFARDAPPATGRIPLPDPGQVPTVLVPSDYDCQKIPE